MLEKINKSIHPNQKTRDPALDCIRVFAIFMVVAEHCTGGLHGSIGLVVEICGSLGVPLFVMLTGYLMLGRDYNGKYLQGYIKNNLIPLFVCIELWNIIWWLFSQYLTPTITVKNALKIAFFLNSSSYDGFWFLPMIFALYLGIPLVSQMLNFLLAQKEKTYLYILIVVLVFVGTIIPTIGEIQTIFTRQNGIQSALQMNIFGIDSLWGGSVWILYLIAGFVLRKFRSQFSVVPTFMLATNIAISYALLLVFYIYWHKQGLSSQPHYSNLLLVICTFSLFILIQRFCTFKKPLSRIFIPLIEQLSKISFSVYMIHFWIIRALSLSPKVLSLKGWEISLICFTLGYVGSVLIGKLLSYVPFLRKWLLLIK